MFRRQRSSEAHNLSELNALDEFVRLVANGIVVRDLLVVHVLVEHKAALPVLGTLIFLSLLLSRPPLLLLLLLLLKVSLRSIKGVAQRVVVRVQHAGRCAALGPAVPPGPIKIVRIMKVNRMYCMREERRRAATPSHFAVAGRAEGSPSNIAIMNGSWSTSCRFHLTPKSSKECGPACQGHTHCFTPICSNLGLVGGSQEAQRARANSLSKPHNTPPFFVSHAHRVELVARYAPLHVSTALRSCIFTSQHSDFNK